MTGTTTKIEGALDSDAAEALAEKDPQAARKLRAEHPFMLGVYRPGEIAAADEVEPGHPIWFSAPRFAKAAGRALVARHPETLGFDVTKVDNGGHYRTVYTEGR